MPAICQHAQTIVAHHFIMSFMGALMLFVCRDVTVAYVVFC